MTAFSVRCYLRLGKPVQREPAVRAVLTYLPTALSDPPDAYPYLLTLGHSLCAVLHPMVDPVSKLNMGSLENDLERYVHLFSD